ncbi:MAG TPA: hypothetical protein VLH75_00735 [Longimicrobiales bacterium]|nr:hypothetical protein [Longimicrobiales bacterium]
MSPFRSPLTAAPAAALLLAVPGCASPPAIPQEPPADTPMEGSWRVVEMHQAYPDGSAQPLHARESFFLFAGSDHSIAWTFGDGPSPPYAERWKPTEEERLARFGSMLVNAGTFEVDGDRMAAHPRFALAPELVGGEIRIRFSSAGDTLRLSWGATWSVDGVPYPSDGASTVLRLVRNGDAPGA